MVKEFKTELAEMHSLLKRMNMHITSSQAQYITENYVEEAGVNTQSGKMEPNVQMVIDEDNSNKTRVLKVFIGPLFDDDIRRITNEFDNCNEGVYNNNKGVIFTKSLPFNKKAKAKKNIQTSNDTQSVAQTTNTQAQPLKPSGLLGRLQAASNINESLLSKLQAASQQPVQATPQANAPDQGSTNEAPQDIVNWFNATIIPAMKNVKNAKPTSYNKSHIDNLLNIDYLVDKYLVAPEKTDSNYNEESAEEIKKEVAQAIKNGDWGAIANVFSPINLQSIIFGNIITDRNQRLIAKQAAAYGINPGDPDYPTNLYAPNKWVKKFGRRVLPNAKYKWEVVAPRMKDRGTTVNLGSKGHYDEFGKDLAGFDSRYLYDINDTERIPAAEYDKYGLDPNKMDPNIDYHADVPGLANNLTGQYNPHAEAAKEAALKAQKSSLTDEQAELLKEIQSDEGKAKVYNDALLKYAEKNKFDNLSSLVDVRTSSNIMYDYAKNIVNVCDYILKKLRYSNQALIEPLKIISAFAIACKTTGAKEVLTSFGRNVSSTKQLLSDWDNACQITLQSVTMIVNFMIKYLMDKYTKFDVDSDNDQNDGDANSVPVTENIEKLLENLLS